MKRRLVLVGILLAVGVAACALAVHQKPIEPAPVVLSRPSGPVSGFFGINEAISIPRKLVGLSHDPPRAGGRGLIPPDKEAQMLAEDARLVRDLGATWVRGNSPVYPYLDHQSMLAGGWDWTRVDRWVGVVQDAELNALVVLGPWPGNRTAAFTDHYLPSDMDVYAEYVRRVVERYDGDGTDDMPGLVRPIKHWEVDNEPDLHNTAPPRGVKGAPAPGAFETPDEYARILLVTAQAIHAADSDATVLSGGIYRPHHKEGRAYLAAVLAHDGVLDAIDALSLHCYFDNDGLGTIERTMATARDLAPGKPVWITETGVPSVSRKGRPWVDEDWHARMVAAVHGQFLAEGAAKVFWHSLADPPNAASHLQRAPMSTHSLLRTERPLARSSSGWGGGRRSDKPAAKVYRRLTALLRDGDLSALDVRITDEGRLLRAASGWLAWWGTPTIPEGAISAEDLLDGSAPALDASVTTPAWISVKAPSAGE